MIRHDPSPFDKELDLSIYQPQLLREFIGQRQLIDALESEVKASIKLNRSLRSKLWSGPAGLGKNTLARLLGVARAVDVIEFESCQSIGRNHLDNLFWGRRDGSYPAHMRINCDGYAVRSINGRDEIHKVLPISPSLVIFDEADGLAPIFHQSLQNVTRSGYPSGHLWYRSDGADVTRWVPDCTLVYLTNFEDRVRKNGYANMERTESYRFQPYSESELHQILMQFAAKSKYALQPDAAELLASISRGTPRYALKLFDGVRDLIAAAHFDGKPVEPVVSKDMVRKTMEIRGLDDMGLTPQERQYLLALYAAVDSRYTLSLPVVTHMLGYESPRAVSETVEPDLLQMGLVICQSGQGRRLTIKGVELCRQIDRSNSRSDKNAGGGPVRFESSPY